MKPPSVLDGNTIASRREEEGKKKKKKGRHRSEAGKRVNWSFRKNGADRK